MKEWKLSLTWKSRGLFLEQLWFAEAAHGAGCEKRAPVNWAAELSGRRRCSCTLMGETWQPKLLMPSLLHYISDWQTAGAEEAGRKIMFWQEYMRVDSILFHHFVQIILAANLKWKKKPKTFTLLCLAHQAVAELRVWGWGTVKGEGVTWPHSMDPGVLVLLRSAQSEGRAEDQGSDRRRQLETCHVEDGHPLHSWAVGQAYVCTVNLGAHTHAGWICLITIPMMCCGLTEELQSCISHGPAGRTEQSERQDGYIRSKLKHSNSQTGTTDQGLHSVNRTHL